MCGFAGEFVFGSGRADVHLADRMADALAHRGPDEEGRFLSQDGRCAIGFRRLAVIDPAGSHQPISSPDGTITVALNGEIYNYRQLRQAAAARGAKFATAGDAEVLIHLYRRLGADLAGELAGMFAWAIYDSTRKRLVLGRDRLGQKPLWYALLPDRLVFASEAKALLLHSHISTSMDSLSLGFYLTLGYIPGPRSIWQGIRKLLPGSVLQCQGGSVDISTYWRPAPSPIGAKPSDVLAEVRGRVTAAVQAAMVSDVPVGALLSGGLDSAVVVAAMAKEAGRAGGIRTFTAGFEQREFDERPAARAVASRCGTEHTELLITPTADGAIDRMVDMFDEPFADSSALPMWLICREARQHVKVVLAGDGGDEVFGGYDRYRAMKIATDLGGAGYTCARAAVWMARPLARGSERRLLQRVVRFGNALSYPPSVQYFHFRRLFGPEDLGRLICDDFAGQIGLREPMRWFCGLYEQEDLPDEVTRAQRHDLLTYLPDDLLVKADRASMANSLELRVPMIEAGLVEFGLSLPERMKVDWRRGKIALREAFKDVLPRQVLRGRKRGFGVPLGDWLRGQLKDEMMETLTDPGLLGRGILRPEAVAGLVNDHLAGREDHGHRLWALLILGRWLARQG